VTPVKSNDSTITNTARRQVSTASGIARQAVTSGAWAYPLYVSGEEISLLTTKGVWYMVWSMSLLSD
jgi:hypothetical protein